MTRWLGVAILVALLVGGCAAQAQRDPRPDVPRSLREKGAETHGEGGY